MGLLKRAVSQYLQRTINIFSILAYHGNISQRNGKKHYCAYFKHGNNSSVSNYRRASLLNNFSKVFELVVHGHMSHYLENKLNLSQVS